MECGMIQVHRRFLTLLLMAGAAFHPATTAFGQLPGQPAGRVREAQEGDVAEEGRRIVSIYADFVAPDGEPVTNVGFAHISGRSTHIFAPTDQHGVAGPLRLSVPKDYPYIRVQTNAGDPLKDRGDYIRRRTKLKQLHRQYYIRTPQDVVLLPDVSEYRVTFVLQPTITLTGRVRTADGREPTKFIGLALRGSHRAGTISADGSMVFPLVQAGVDNEIFFTDQRLVTSVRITAQQTATDFDLGKILLPEMGAAVVPMEVYAHDAGKLPDDIRKGWRGATFISVDGTRILSYEAFRADLLVDNPESDELPVVPVGSFYIAPQVFNATPGQMWLLNAIRDKRDLTGLDIPLFNVKPDVSVATLEFDALELYWLIREQIEKDEAAAAIDKEASSSGSKN